MKIFKQVLIGFFVLLATIFLYLIVVVFFQFYHCLSSQYRKGKKIAKKIRLRRRHARRSGFPSVELISPPGFIFPKTPGNPYRASS